MTVVLLGCLIGHSAGADRDGPEFSSRGLGTATGSGDIGTHVSLWDRLVPKGPEARTGWGSGRECRLRGHTSPPIVRSKADLKLKVPEKVVTCRFVSFPPSPTPHTPDDHFPRPCRHAGSSCPSRARGSAPRGARSRAHPAFSLSCLASPSHRPPWWQ